MTDADLADNPVVPVHVSYGEREKMLGKGLDKDLPLELAATMFSTKQLFANPAIIVGIAIAVIIAAMVLLMRRRKK